MRNPVAARVSGSDADASAPREALRALAGLLRSDVVVADDFAPSRDFAFHVCAELRPRAACGIRAHAHQALTNAGHLQHSQDVSVQLRDDRCRRLTRCEDTIPGIGLVAGPPASAMVGTDGSARVRCALVTPSALSLPVFTCGSAASMLPNMSCTSPAITARPAGRLPL
jgi:hypothetical protein